MMKKVLSVVVFSYNHQNYVEKSLDSIFMQKTEFDFEVLLADDYSTDDTLNVVRNKFGDKVRILDRTHNLGLCRNMYDAFMQAEGKYIYCCSGDDYLLTDHVFQKHVDFLEENSEYFSVFNYVKVINIETGIERINRFSYEKYTFLDFLQGVQAHFYMGTVRNSFKEDNPEYLCKAGRNNEEIQILYYTLTKGNKAIIPEVMYAYCYRRDAQNYNSQNDYLSMLKDYAKGFRAVEAIDYGKHRFDVARVWYFERYIDRIIESGNVHSIMAIFRVLSLREIFSWIWIKLLIKFNHRKIPRFLIKKNRLVR